MKKYTWILFDADDTLFHFDAFSGLKRTFSQLDIEFTVQDYEEYEARNRDLWVEYQNNTITTEELKTRRFDKWAAQLNCSPWDLNRSFISHMAEICTPLEGAASLLNALQGSVKLGIVTNGFTDLQQRRLERTGFDAHFDLIVISEEVGFAKPHQGIFDHALALMGHPEREYVLMVGDNPASDILGGMNAGLHTCWLNRHGQMIPEGITPDYHVTSLGELEGLLMG